MSSSSIRPKWWQVYLTFPLMVMLFVLDHRLSISTRAHQVIQIGIVLLTYGLIHVWLKANARALSGMEQVQQDRRIKVLRIPVAQLPESDNAAGVMFQLPDSEIQGMLSDTFEMDYIDAQFSPVDEVSQESKKE